MNLFSSLPLSVPLLRALESLDYAEMTPIQAASLPPMLGGRDVIAQARTGSGKTAAFGLALLSRLDTAVSRTQVLVLCPTRELADQVSKHLRRLARFIANVKLLTLCGGIPLRPQIASLAHEPHIVVGTPGRIQELADKGHLKLDTVSVLVLDEADKMLEMGFAEAIAAVVAWIPKQRQTLLFSATYSEGVRETSRKLQHEPVEVTVADTDDGGNAIEQVFYEVDPTRKAEALEALLSEHCPESALVFCNTKRSVQELTDRLALHGHSVLALHGDLEQRERDEVLVRFANQSCRTLIATDVAARGLDIQGLPMVVSFELATDPDAHLHRIGRTGRAGQRGLALSLCAGRELERVPALESVQGGNVRWGRLDFSKTARQAPPAASMATLIIDAGRQDKLRPGDVLGALTGDAKLPAEAVGKIDVFATRTYVAIRRDQAGKAMEKLRAGKIKGRSFRIRK